MMPGLPSPDARQRRWLLLALILPTAVAAKALNMSEPLRAVDHFADLQLEMARAIDARDMARLESLARRADPSRPGRQGLTLMWYAMLPERLNVDAVQTLVRLGVDPDLQVVEGLGSAMSVAIRSKDLRILKAMLDGGLSPNHTNAQGEDLLARASGPGGSLPHVKLLVERGARLDVRDSIGATALDNAVDAMNPDIALFLIEKGAPVDTAMANGSTVAWAVHRIIEAQRPGPLRSAFEAVRDKMVERGVRFPPDPPPARRNRRSSSASPPP